MEKEELKSMSFNRLERELSRIKEDRHIQKLALARIWVKLGNKRYSINYAKIKYLVVNYEHDDQETIRLKENFNKRLDSYFEINKECLLYADEMKRRRELRKQNRNTSQPSFTTKLKEVNDEIMQVYNKIKEINEILPKLKQKIDDLDKEARDLQSKRELTLDEKLRILAIASEKQKIRENYNRYVINLINLKEKIDMLKMTKQFMTNSIVNE